MAGKTAVLPVEEDMLVLRVEVGGREVDVHFFEPGACPDSWKLAEQYKKRKLQPANLYLFEAVNKQFPDFHPYYATQWMDEEEEWWYAASYLVNGERVKSVYRYARGWPDGYMFAGVPLSAL